MGFRRHDLQPAVLVPGTYPFTVWGYGTTDPLEDVLRPRYLRGAQAMFALGDLIYVSTRPRYEPREERELGEVRKALAMVSRLECGDATVRLVQDYGGPTGDTPDGIPSTTAEAAKGSPTRRRAPCQPGPDAAAEAAEAPATPPQRKRGRPPGSRTRKPAFTESFP